MLFHQTAGGYLNRSYNEVDKPADRPGHRKAERDGSYFLPSSCSIKTPARSRLHQHQVISSQAAGRAQIPCARVLPRIDNYILLTGVADSSSKFSVSDCMFSPARLIKERITL